MVKKISWSHLADLYSKDKESSTAPGLALLPKVIYEHIHLTPYAKMRVDLAVQV